MSQRRPTVGRAVASDISTLGSAAVWLGLVVTLAMTALAVAAGAELLAEAATVEGALSLALVALDEPLVGTYNTARLFHVGVVGLLVGTWVLGAGLVLEGLFD